MIRVRFFGFVSGFHHSYLKIGCEVGLEYELYAVVLHIGTSAHGGHYVSHVLQEAGNWLEIDDEETREITAEQVGMTIGMRNNKGKGNNLYVRLFFDLSPGRKGNDLDESLIIDYEEDEDDFEAEDDFMEDVVYGGRRKRNKNKNKKKKKIDVHPDVGSPVKSPAKKTGKNAGKKAAVVDLEKFTAGSPAPYLLFYRRKEFPWNAEECVPPVYATKRVEEEHMELQRRAEQYTGLAKDVNDRLGTFFCFFIIIIL
jgi:hypothetical protein